MIKPKYEIEIVTPQFERSAGEAPPTTAPTTPEEWRGFAGPAIAWRDGWARYSLHGLGVRPASPTGLRRLDAMMRLGANNKEPT